MKSKLLCGIIGAALFTSPTLFASIIGTGSLFITAPGFSANGDQAGPYLVSSLTPLTGVNPGSTFETFCIGTQVDYNPGLTYSYQISDTVQPASGVGAPGYVTWGTAWLYSQYRAGLLPDGAKGVNGAINNGATDALQELIWSLQGQSLSGVTFNADANVYSDLSKAVMAAAAAAGVSDGSDADGAFGVYSLNMLSGSTFVQPQLCMVPVPEPTTFLAGGLMLLPFVVSALRIARKRLA